MAGDKTGNSGAVIRYQVDEFTHIWSVECFIAQSDIYLGFTGKVFMVTHITLEPGCEDYSFLTRPLSMVSILSSKTPSTHQNWMHPLMGLMPYPLQSLYTLSTQLILLLILPDCSKFLASNLINYGARPRLCFSLSHRKVKCPLFYMIHYFSSHPAAFGFWSFLPHDSNTMNPVNKRTDQDLSAF